MVMCVVCVACTGGDQGVQSSVEPVVTTEPTVDPTSTTEIQRNSVAVTTTAPATSSSVSTRPRVRSAGFGEVLGSLPFVAPGFVLTMTSWERLREFEPFNTIEHVDLDFYVDRFASGGRASDSEIPHVDIAGLRYVSDQPSIVSLADTLGFAFNDISVSALYSAPGGSLLALGLDREANEASAHEHAVVDIENAVATFELDVRNRRTVEPRSTVAELSLGDIAAVRSVMDRLDSPETTSMFVAGCCVRSDWLLDADSIDTVDLKLLDPYSAVGAAWGVRDRQTFGTLVYAFESAEQATTNTSVLDQLLRGESFITGRPHGEALGTWKIASEGTLLVAEFAGVRQPAFGDYWIKREILFTVDYPTSE